MVRQGNVLLHQDRDGVESVEKKMRMELHLERVELCMGQLRFKLRSADFALAILAIVIEALRQADKRPVSQKLEVKTADELISESCKERLFARIHANHGSYRDIDSKQEKGYDDACSEVQREVFQPVLPSQRKPS